MTRMAIHYPLSSILDLRSSILNRRGAIFALLAICLLVITGCDDNLRYQGRIKPYEPVKFYPNEQSARPAEPNTIARGNLRTDDAFYAGKDASGNDVETFPFPVTKEVLVRGQERFNAFCTPCHGYRGDGNGMIVQRGLSPPPTFHQDRLRTAPVGHFYEVISNGQGAMYPYGSRIAPEDRWAIIAYIRALQLSQNASMDDVPPDQRGALGGK